LGGTHTEFGGENAYLVDRDNREIVRAVEGRAGSG